MPKPIFLNWPNVVTFCRILFIPAILVLAGRQTRTSCFLGALLFTIASFSDALDGYLARKLGQVSALGKLVDPLADKLVIVTCLILLVSLGWLDAWMAMVVVGRELAVTTLRGVATTQGMVIAASESGKHKAFFQNVATGFLLLHFTYFNIDGAKLGLIFMWIALVYTVWSGIDYFRKYLRGALGESR